VEPAGVVVVGDKEDEDIMPAKAMGCRTILLIRAGGRYSHEQAKKTQADEVARSLIEVEQIIRSWTFAHVAVRELVAK